jgi:hypothetical protein
VTGETRRLLVFLVRRGEVRRGTLTAARASVVAEAIASGLVEGRVAAGILGHERAMLSITFAGRMALRREIVDSGRYPANRYSKGLIDDAEWFEDRDPWELREADVRAIVEGRLAMHEGGAFAFPETYDDADDWRFDVIHGRKAELLASGVLAKYGESQRIRETRAMLGTTAYQRRVTSPHGRKNKAAAVAA